MARRPRAPSLENRTNRLKLPIRGKPYTAQVAPGIRLAYRRNRTAGVWSVIASDGHGNNWLKKFAGADDHEDANGESVLTYWQAIDKARALARGTAEGNGDRPPTVVEAVDSYEADLKARGGDVKNAGRVRGHLTQTLASKTVGLLTAKDLTAWRAGLIAGGLSPAAADRTARVLKAALALAARNDRRIGDGYAWRVGLKRLPSQETHNPRNVILPDNTVTTIVGEAYGVSPQYGRLVEVAAVTGARASQIVRLDVADLIAGGDKPRLLMPSSLKGKKKPHREPVPIPTTLAAALKAEARGRGDDAPLLTDEAGARWRVIDVAVFREIAAKLKLADDVTPYALRHSSIARMLKANVPVRIVAAHHDTSVVEIERTYSRYILADADAMTRAVLLDVSSKATAPDNVMALKA